VNEPKKKSRRGFAAMDPEKQREIARKGGQAAVAGGKGHRWTREEAVEAGKRGGRRAALKRAGIQMDMFVEQQEVGDGK
jgi:general stress protein YciG